MHSNCVCVILITGVDVKNEALIVVAICAFITTLLWAGALVKNSVLTTTYRYEMKSLQFFAAEETLPEFDWYRITSYSNSTIKIYYVNTYGKCTDSEYKVGGEIVFCRMPAGWDHTDLVEIILWSCSGLADHYIWTYWHHIFLLNK